MNNLISVITIITALTITSCGGGGQNGDKLPVDNKYVGIWYDDGNDTYLKILDSGVASLYICTLHEGYQENSGIYAEVINDELNVTEEQSSHVYSLQIQNQNLLLSSTNVSLALTMADSIPTICENDAIEIVYLSPLEVYEGELTTFIVNYEYRLTSALAQSPLLAGSWPKQLANLEMSWLVTMASPSRSASCGSAKTRGGEANARAKNNEG
jgi:hypothetical protein